MGSSGFEPPTSRLSGVRSNQLSYEPIPGGDERVRTDGLLLARQALSQLSYTPVFGCDQLSRSTLQQSEDVLTPSKPYSAFDAFQRFFFSATFSFLGLHLRKEVIQPHLPIRLPCYDFTPIISSAFDGWLLTVTSPASGVSDSHSVTGGVYKARERIHRGMLTRDY